MKFFQSWRYAAAGAVLLLLAAVGAPRDGLAAFDLLIEKASQAATQGPPVPRPEVLEATRTDTSAPLRTRPPIPPVAGELRELPRKFLPNREGSSGPAGDGALQGPTTAPSVPSHSGKL